MAGCFGPRAPVYRLEGGVLLAGQGRHQRDRWSGAVEVVDHEHLGPLVAITPWS